MAHLFSFLPVEEPNYVNGKKSSSQIKYPGTGFFQGFNKPSKLEGDIFDLEVSGTIPADINGTFYRIQPDHRYPPLFEEDIHFSGDGNVSAFRFENGHVDFKQRYVHTDRFGAETRERKALFGKYRNMYTDSEMVKGIIRTVSNTNIVFWRGMLLATKEDGPPFAMDPVTLETIGRYDFEGQVQSPTFTAHPKFDPKTGEMVCFGYEAGGDGHDASCDIVVYTIDKHGKKTEECWYKAPFCGMIHDCGLSENYLVLPMTPLKASLERMKKGGNHFAWDPKEDQLYGIVPRRGGKPEDIVWLRADNGFHGHVAGCYENEDGYIVFDLTIADDNVFFFFPPEDAPPETLQKRNKLVSKTFRWIFDPKAKTDTRVTPAEIFDINGEFSRIDDRLVTKKYNHFWQVQIDPSKPYDFQKCGSPAGGLFNAMGHFTWDEKVQDVYWAGPTTTFQEPIFVPKDTDIEGDGYLIALLNHLDELRNDILIFDALNLAKGPLAAIHLPLKLRLGLHGNFVDQKEIDAWKELRRENGEVGPIKAAEKPLAWQEGLVHVNGTNGTDGIGGHKA
ncbi:related to lignostilbene dioxygenase [Phialocephala subalpina]|uniref:Related to lignostilbene dioxygenase n=1 Tax=Phialocephala subalpina TaxID=576137 RepID=A0A1L7WR79_9HELO|nr:related to lignostilbene dioxygenase [Phialocephala subalpina]